MPSPLIHNRPMLIHPGFIRGDLIPTNASSLNCYRVSDGRAIIGIGGMLIHDSAAYERAERHDIFATYSRIRRDLDRALEDEDVDEICVHIDSGGGHAAGCFDLVDHIHAARGIKPITAIIDEHAYSGAYAIASAADRIVVPRTGSVGSIGVVVFHFDYSRMLDRGGVTVTTVLAGDEKDLFSPYRPMTEDERATIQAEVDETYELFVATIARNRGLSEGAVRATQAATYGATEALELGLIDEIAPAVHAFNSNNRETKQGENDMPEEQTETKKRSGLLSLFFGPSREEAEEVATDQLEEIKARIDAEKTAAAQAVQQTVNTQLTQLRSALLAEKDAAVTAAKSAAANEVMDLQKSIFESCKAAGREDLAGAIMAEGLDLDKARERLAERMAVETEEVPVVSLVDPTAEASRKEAYAAIDRVNARRRNQL